MESLLGKLNWNRRPKRQKEGTFTSPPTHPRKELKESKEDFHAQNECKIHGTRYSRGHRKLVKHMSQRVVSESVSDEDTAAAAEAVVVLRNSLLEIVDIENCPPKRKNREFTRSRLPKSLTVKGRPLLRLELKGLQR
ncbi:hypothetical protein RYX36_013325 [Vicia faba]